MDFKNQLAKNKEFNTLLLQKKTIGFLSKLAVEVKEFRFSAPQFVAVGHDGDEFRIDNDADAWGGACSYCDGGWQGEHECEHCCFSGVNNYSKEPEAKYFDILWNIMDGGVIKCKDGVMTDRHNKVIFSKD